MYKAKRMGSNFNIKDKIAFKHQHNVVYHVECPNKKCDSDYTGETKCRIEKRSDQHHGKDKKSHIYRHSQETKHKRVNIHAFQIIGKGFRSNFARKISEALYIKKLKPNLNIQKESYKLALFNWFVYDVRYWIPWYWTIEGFLTYLTSVNFIANLLCDHASWSLEAKYYNHKKWRNFS